MPGAIDLADVDQHICHPCRLEIIRDEVAGVSLRDCIEVQERRELPLRQGGGVERYARGDGIAEASHPAGLHRRADLVVGGQRIGGEAEAPDVEKRPCSHVHAAIGLLPDVTRERIDVGEKPVRNNDFAGIEAAQLGGLVVSGQCGVDEGEDGVDGRGNLLLGDPDARSIELDGVRSALGIPRDGDVASAPRARAQGQQHGGSGYFFNPHIRNGKVFVQR